MKLELKHLAAYLPYGLKYQLKGNFPTKEGVENIIEDIRKITPFDFTLKKVLEWGSCKPILRPLSDLTKQIEHNGIKFYLMDFIGEEVYDFPDSTFDTDYTSYFVDLDVYLTEFQDVKWTDHHLKFLPYGLIQLLLMLHFDIYNLIPNDLAIDMNTLSVNDQLPNSSK